MKLLRTAPIFLFIFLLSPVLLADGGIFKCKINYYLEKTEPVNTGYFTLVGKGKVICSDADASLTTPVKVTMNGDTTAPAIVLGNFDRINVKTNEFQVLKPSHALGSFELPEGDSVWMQGFTYFRAEKYIHDEVSYPYEFYNFLSIENGSGPTSAHITNLSFVKDGDPVVGPPTHGKCHLHFDVSKDYPINFGYFTLSGTGIIECKDQVVTVNVSLNGNTVAPAVVIGNFDKISGTAHYINVAYLEHIFGNYEVEDGDEAWRMGINPFTVSKFTNRVRFWVNVKAVNLYGATNANLTSLSVEPQ